MQKEITTNDGKILQLLIFNSGVPKKEVAEGINVHPDYISKLIASKSLSKKVKRDIIHYFGLSDDYFDINQKISHLQEAKSPSFEHRKLKNESTEANSDYLKIIQEMQQNYHEERMKMLGIIEKLSNN